MKKKQKHSTPLDGFLNETRVVVYYIKLDTINDWPWDIYVNAQPFLKELGIIRLGLL